MDFSNCELSGINYGGTEKKLGIKMNGEKYMLKFRKESQFGSKYNHISEHIGSTVFSLLGFNAQHTILGTYRNHEVVACSDFLKDGTQFVPFNDVGESTLEQDKESYQYSYEDIMHMLEENRKLTDVQETISIFWKMYIVDALLGNFDRHGGNWGFIKENNRYRLAPVFDNGSCLFSQLTDENMMAKIMNSQSLTDERIYKFPTSQILLNGKKSSYFDIINSLQFPECNKALTEVFPTIVLKTINSVIDNVSEMTDTHKKFCQYMIEQRYTKILKASYDRLIKNEL